MNLLIIDNANKQFDYYMHTSTDIQNHIISNILKINKKNSSALQIITDTDSQHYENLGYIMNQGIYDKLLYNYNANLIDGEKPLIRWL